MTTALRDTLDRIHDLRAQLFAESGRVAPGVDSDKAIALRSEIGRLTQEARRLQAQENQA